MGFLEFILTVLAFSIGSLVTFKFVKINNYNQNNINKTINENNSQIAEIINNNNIIFDRIEKLENKSYKIIDKLLLVLEFHNIKKSNFSKFFPKKFNVDLECFENQEHFYKRINSGVLLPWLSKELNLEEKWFYDESDFLYNFIRPNFYKNITGYIDYIIDLIIKKEDFDIFLLKTSKLDSSIDGRKQKVYMIFRIKVKNINGEDIFKYEFSPEIFYWDYWRSNFELKTIIYLYEQVLKRHFWCGNINSEDFSMFIKGSFKFQDLFKKYGSSEPNSWYAYDYVPPKHLKSKEINQYEELETYMEFYVKYLNEKIKKYDLKITNLFS